MNNYLFEPAATRSVPVLGEEARYPVHRIFCVGRNYVAHAAEMGVEVDREAPFYFTKSALATEPSGATLPYPPGTSDYHYEMELVVAIGSPIFRIDRADAFASVLGYGCGLDMTRRDLQMHARGNGRPWDLGKDFEHSAVFAPLTRADDFGLPGEQRIHLEVDGKTRQDAQLSEMVWKVDEILAHLSHFYHLQPGDLIMTGTPAGVGSVTAGNRITGGIDGLEPVSLTVGEPE